MELVGNNIEEQTKQVLKNISVVLRGVGLTLTNIVKTTVYLKDMEDFQGMNKAYEEIFNGHKPARTTISIKQNPLDALVEIECIAELEYSNMISKSHFILYVEDQSKSTEFYSKLLNQNPTLNVPGMTEFKLTDNSVLGLMPSQVLKNY